jgi:hypothetical protein
MKYWFVVMKPGPCARSVPNVFTNNPAPTRSTSAKRDLRRHKDLANADAAGDAPLSSFNASVGCSRAA